jgi:LacI family transcriptional regulator
MALLLEHLYALGHRRMAFVSGGWLGDIRERQEAYRDFVESRHLVEIDGYSQTDTNDSDGGARAMRRLIGLPLPPTAVIAADDVMAIGVLKAATDAGLRVPQDVSVTGFDDIEMARFTSPALTTVRQPVEAMSRQALDWLVRLMSGDVDLGRPDIMRIQPELVVRQTTGAAPPAH